MAYGVLKALIGTLSICVISSGAFLHAQCSIDTIIVNGRVEHAPRKGIVKVQLIYPKDKIGESGDVTVEDESFRIPILFFTQSRAPFLNGSIRTAVRADPQSLHFASVGDCIARPFASQQTHQR